MMQDWALFVLQMKREWVIQLREKRYLINFCLFFMMMLFIFPLTLKPDTILMRLVGPGLIWMALLLSLLLSADRLLQQDYDNGVLEQWMISGQSLPLIISAKVATHGLLHIIPILVLCPLGGLLFGLGLWPVIILMLSLLCGMPVLIFLCALATSFGLGLNQKGALMGLILFPLTLPVLIFGSGCVHIAMQGLPVSSYLALLLAISLLSVTFIPFAIAGVLRINQTPSITSLK